MQGSELQIFWETEFWIWRLSHLLDCMRLGGFRDWIGWDMSIVQLQAGILRWTFCAFSALVFSVTDGFNNSRSFDFFYSIWFAACIFYFYYPRSGFAFLRLAVSLQAVWPFTAQTNGIVIWNESWKEIVKKSSFWQTCALVFGMLWVKFWTELSSFHFRPRKFRKCKPRIPTSVWNQTG